MQITPKSKEEGNITPTGALPTPTKFSDSMVKKKKVKLKKTVLIRKKPSLNVMAQAMRLFFVKHLRKQLNEGRIQTKYLTKFEVSFQIDCNLF